MRNCRVGLLDAHVVIPHSEFRIPRFVLRLQILIHPFSPTFSSKARFPVPPESRRSIEQVGRVDPDNPGLEFRRHVEGEIDVLRPHTRRESIGRIVRQLHRFFRRAERHAHQHRAEDLDLGNRRSRRHVGEERRRIEVAFGGARPGGLPHLRPFLDSLLHQTANALELHRRDDRTHVHGFVERRAHAQLLHARPQLLREPIGDAFLNEQA